MPDYTATPAIPQADDAVSPPSISNRTQRRYLTLSATFNGPTEAFVTSQPIPYPFTIRAVYVTMYSSAPQSNAAFRFGSSGGVIASQSDVSNANSFGLSQGTPITGFQSDHIVMTVGTLQMEAFNATVPDNNQRLWATFYNPTGVTNGAGTVTFLIERIDTQ